MPEPPGRHSLAPPAQPPVHPQSTATLGLVTNVNDPEGLGRIRVKLPSYSDLESEWLEVVLPAAGADKGFIALPDVDDRVLVLLVEFE